MGIRAEIGLSILIGVLAAPLAAAKTAIDADGMALVDGKRTFIIGLYENPASDDDLKKVAEAGFNLVQAGAEAKALDRLRERGLNAWISLGVQLDLGEDRTKREEGLRAAVSIAAAHPALIVWEGPDEALWNAWYDAQTWRTSDEPRQQTELIRAISDETKAGRLRSLRAEASDHFARGEFAEGERLADSLWRELGKESPRPGLNLSDAPQRAARLIEGLGEGRALLKRLDPDHPLWMNHAPRNSVAQLAAYNVTADIVGCDIYPAPDYRVGHSDLGDQSTSSVGAYTRLMQAAAPGKPVWMVLQGFGWADLRETAGRDARQELRRPTLAESRFMAYDAIVRGARGVLYWGTYAIEKDSQLWKDLLQLARELSGLQPVIAARDAALGLTVTLGESWGSLDRAVEVLAKEAEGGPWFLVVNESPDPMTYTIAGLRTLDGKTYCDPVAGRQAAVNNGRLSLSLAGRGVHVLRPGALEPKR